MRARWDFELGGKSSYARSGLALPQALRRTCGILCRISVSSHPDGLRRIRVGRDILLRKRQQIHAGRPLYATTVPSLCPAIHPDILLSLMRVGDGMVQAPSPDICVKPLNVVDWKTVFQNLNHFDFNRQALRLAFTRIPLEASIRVKEVQRC